MLRARMLLLACLAGCGVRTPAAIDVDALVRARGPEEARRDLVIRVTSEPRDVSARLALAALAERSGRPGEAIEMLEAVVKLGGPLGTRWHAEDRERLARLIAARGRVRLARGAWSAQTDLLRARSLGAAIRDDELRAARLAIAIGELRHSDGETRARGVATVVELGAQAGARGGATVEERGRFGVWLWEQGAKRAAWDVLASAKAPGAQQAYLIAARWWTPLDRPAPPASELVGAARCAFGACSAVEVVGDDALERSYLAAPLPVATKDAAEAAAILTITMHQALRGEAAWGPAYAARVERDVVVADRDARTRLAWLSGRAALSAEDEALVAVPASAPLDGDPRAIAAARYVELVAGNGAALRAAAEAYFRDPAIADRLARDAIAAAPDAAIMQAAVGALFDALADPARARTAWQAAVDASPEPAFLRGLAEAQARAGDGDAALITATAAAAASGDPSVVWTAVAASLAGVGRSAHALEAARSAIDLASGDTLGAALDAAIAASRALERNEQVDQLAAQRARLLGSTGTLSADDPTDPRAALAADRASPDASRRLWIASRWNPRNVELRAALRPLLADDPRLATITSELIQLAGDADRDRARAAVAALR